LTPDQYQQLEKEGKDLSKRWFTIIPKNLKHDVSELLIVDENEAKTLMDAAKYVNHLCEKAESQDQFLSFDDKLKYAATILPKVFSQSSIYAEKKMPYLKIVKLNITPYLQNSGQTTINFYAGRVLQPRLNVCKKGLTRKSY